MDGDIEKKIKFDLFLLQIKISSHNVLYYIYWSYQAKLQQIWNKYNDDVSMANIQLNPKLHLFQDTLNLPEHLFRTG